MAKEAKKIRSLETLPLYASITFYTYAELYVYGLVPIRNIKENDNSRYIYQDIYHFL